MRAAFVTVFALLITASADLLGAQPAPGDLSVARKLLRQANRSADQIENVFFRAIAFHKIAASQVKAGDLEEALLTANKEGNVSKEETLEAIVNAQLKMGNIAEASEIAAGIQDDYWKTGMLQSIAAAHIGVGNQVGAAATLKEALKAALSIRDLGLGGHTGAYMVLRVVEGQADAGDMVGAKKTLRGLLDTARTMEDLWARDTTLADIAGVQAAMGDAAEAFLTACAIQDEDKKSIAIRNIATRQARSGNVSEALETASTVPAAFYRAQAFLWIAEAQAKAGDIEGALRIASAISQQYTSKAIALRRIAEEQAERTHWEAARQTLLEAVQAAHAIQSPKWRAMTLADIAWVQAGFGDWAEAFRSIEKAIAASEAISEIPDKQSPLLKITEAQVRAGDIKGALKTAGSMTSDFSTDRAFFQIAKAQAQAGDFTQALQTAALSQGYEFMWRAYTLQLIARIQSHRGGQKEALRWATRQSQASDVAFALLGVAEGILMQGESVDMEPNQ